METKFKNRFKEIEETLIDNMDCHVLLAKKGEDCVTSMKRRLVDEIVLLHEAVEALRNDLTNYFPKPIANMVLNYINHDDRDEMKPEEPKSIPEWLRRLMDVDDDNKEEDDDEEEGTVPDDNPEREALEKALNGLAKAIRDATGADNVDVVCGHVGRRKDRS